MDDIRQWISPWVPSLGGTSLVASAGAEEPSLASLLFRPTLGNFFVSRFCNFLLFQVRFLVEHHCRLSALMGRSFSLHVKVLIVGRIISIVRPRIARPVPGMVRVLVRLPLALLFAYCGYVCVQHAWGLDYSFSHGNKPMEMVFSETEDLSEDMKQLYTGKYVPMRDIL
jgi:hypothetical protein